LNITCIITKPIRKKNTLKTCEFVLSNFNDKFGHRDLKSLKAEEVLSFLVSLTKNNTQATKRNRYSVLTSFFNFTINTSQPDLMNPCSSAVIRKVFKRPQPNQWQIIDKDIVDEIIFRCLNIRDRLILELMARGGMRVGEVLKLRPQDIQDRKLIIQNPKSGKPDEVVYIPRKLFERLRQYVRENDIHSLESIFSLSYVSAWSMVKRAGEVVGIKLRPHDLRRHAATYASRSGTPIEIVSKVILRHSDLSTTQRYLGTVNDAEAIRWIESLHG
jgi:integrase/recombinase XerD